MNFLFSTVGCNIAANGWRYETLGISELFHDQGTTNYDASTKVRLTTSPPMFYDRVLATALIYSLFFALFLIQVFLYYILFYSIFSDIFLVQLATPRIEI